MFIITTDPFTLTLPTGAPLVYLTETCYWVYRRSPIPTYPYCMRYDEPWDFLLDRSRVPDINYACLRAQLPATRDRFICPRVPSETSKELLKN